MVNSIGIFLYLLFKTKNMKLKIISVALIGLVIYSCSPKIVPPVVEARTETVADVKPTLPPDIAEGKSIFENNCAKCHKLYDPKSYSRQNWIPILYDMQKKANLSDAEIDKVLAYVSYQ
jgi:cytochrome c5